MKSMTGYGVSNYASSDYSLNIAIRSVNGRFLETRFHLGREYAPMEMQLKKKIQERFRRGTVDIYISRRGQFSDKEFEVKLRKTTVKRWKTLITELSKELGLKNLKESFNASHFLHLPHVYEMQEGGAITSKEKNLFLKVFNESLLACEKERVREGQALRRELLRILEALYKATQKMDALRSKAMSQLEARLKEKLVRLKVDHAVDETRFAQEVVMLVDKADITEELTRLTEHVKTCLKMVKNDDSQGKALEFYSQELLREVNTIGSKSNLQDMTDLVVQSKTLIENLREQVQNIE